MANFIVNSALNSNVTLKVFVGTANNIDWGDSSPLDSVTNGQISHTYAAPGNYTVTFSGVGITNLQFSENNNITSLNINDLTSLSTLECVSNSLSTLDVSNNTNLTYLSCRLNQLTALNVSGNTLLVTLNAEVNQLPAIDVSNNTALTSLNCTNNLLSTLDVSNNTLLQNLNTGNNQLSTLDVSNNTALTSLTCPNNLLSTLDVSNNTLLQNLNTSNNQLSTLDVSNNTALTNLTCSNNLLSTLNIGNKPNLTLLECQNNQLSTLDISNTPNLTLLECQNNQLSTLDISNNTDLIVLRCQNNQLPTNEIDNILSDLVDFDLSSGVLNGSNQTPKAIPLSPTGDNNKNILISSGWSITLDSGYKVINCLTNEEQSVVSSSNLSIGNVIFYSDDIEGGQNYCGIITGGTPSEPYLTYINSQSSCLDCILFNPFFFEFSSCTEEGVFINANAGNFVLNYGSIPSINQIYLLKEFGETLGCYTLTDIFYNTGTTGSNATSDFSPFIDCDCSYKYKAIDCLTSQDIGRLGFTETQTFGTNISVTDGVNYYCVTIGSPITGEITLTAVTSYETCFDCLTGTPEINISVNKCNDEISYVVPTTGFTSLSELTQVTYVCLEQLEEKSCICGTSTQTNNPIDTTLLSVGYAYQSCDTCLYFNTPRSANTETILCQQVCVSGGSEGYTVVQVVPPHPVWTDGYGIEVTQMNAVTLGGMFGLNS